MYEKPELTLVGNAVNVVLGPAGERDDNDVLPLEGGLGLVQGLDE